MPTSPAKQGVALSTVGPEKACASAFAESGKLPAGMLGGMPREVRDGMPVLAFAFKPEKVGPSAISRHLMLAYDDLYSITYFRKNLRPYWRRDGGGIADLLRKAEAEYDALLARSKAFDEQVMADLTRAGGAKYARIGALAYRQAMAAHKLVADPEGKPLLFSKENFSNGCIATVDVIYPAAPIFLLFSPTLAKASLVPVLNYSASGRWKFPFAPHDLGTYPMANGQVYGGGERTEDNQMPVEETGNMLLLLAAIARIDGNADFAGPYWPQLRALGRLPGREGVRPREPALHRRLRRPPGAQRQPLGQGDPGPRVLRPPRRVSRREGRGQARYHALGKSLAARWVRAKGPKGTTPGWPSTGPGPGARSTTWSGTSSSASTSSRRR